MASRIALAGNPNCGKTTLFNALTGSNQYVGNWPGVTVEKKEGKLKKHDDVTVVDLPGIYSLSPYTLEEVVARKYLVNERPEAILNIVDGTNIERNLYLTTQLTELGIPVAVAVNMMDIVRKNGDSIDFEKLSKALGCRVVEISALKGDGITEAAEAAIEAAMNGRTIPMHTFSGAVEHAIAHIEEAAVHDFPDEQQRWYAIKIFERDERVLEKLELSEVLKRHIEKDIASAERELDDDAESIITNERYNYIASALSGAYKKRSAGRRSITDKIDRIVTNRILALPIFAVIIWFVYTISIGTVGDWTVGFMNDTLFGGIIIPGARSLLEAIGCADWLISLIADGIISGVGAVLGFVPQMMILFMLLSLLEDCGYMSRVAFILDKIFRKFGLSGKSFIPLLVATGCGVPGIMASRTIESERDRRMTVMTTGFMVCGAKTPIVGLLAAALFDGGAWVATAAYFIGIAAVVVSGIILKKFKAFAGNPAPFVMEMPAYHMPLAKNVFRTTWDRGWGFIKRAGTVIVAAGIIIWVLNSFSVVGGLHFISEEQGGASVLENIGTAISFLFVPLGFDSWQAAVATVLGLVAKEEVVGTFGSLSSMASAEWAAGAAEAMDSGLSIIGTEFFGGSKLAGFSFMIFNLLCAPCFAAMGAIRREMNSAKWTWAAIGWMCTFAYSISLIVYQAGVFINGGFSIWTIAALAVLAALVWLLVRPNKYEGKVKETK